MSRSERWTLVWNVLSILVLVWAASTAVLTGDFLGVGGAFLTWLVVAKAFNRRTMADGAANTPLGMMHGIDFDIAQHKAVYDEPWRGRLERKEITAEQASEAARMYLNVILEHRFVLAAVKPSA